MNVVWKPLPGSQSLSLTAPVNHLLLHGTRGGGKTDVQPMRFRKHVGQGYGQFWRGIIFDREYKSLDDIIAKTKRHFPKFGDGAKFLSGQGQYAWKWPTGEELLFRVMKNPDDYLKYHGQEFPFIGFNELTKWPTSDCYELIQSCNRSGFVPDKHSPDLLKPLPDIPLEVVSTTNPSGPGHNWVKRRFIDPVSNGQVLKRSSTVFNPRTQKEEVITKTQVAIFSSYKENIYLPPEYVMDLQSITDPNKKKAWLEGDWDVSAGGALDDIWDSKVHILDRFVIPKGWRLTRSFDWGSSHPFSTGWWGISNGEEVMVGGKKMCFPKGSLIRCAELYGAEDRAGDTYGHNTGVKWSARKVAQRQKQTEEELLMLGWIYKKPAPGPADSQIYAVNESESGCIGDLMAQEGIKWTPADKRAGTRKNGLQMMRDMLENAVKGEGPGLYVMRNCQAFINTVPVIPRDSKDPDDVDTEAIDHVYDDARYMVLDARPELAKAINVGFVS